MLSRIFIVFFLCSHSLLGQTHKDLIQGSFKTLQDVTNACLMYHENASGEVMKISHWTWLDEKFTDDDNKTVQRIKINFINNFCHAVPSDNPRYTSCHTGYGWKDDKFDFSEEENVDCLVCNDQTGKYTKTPTGAGIPDKNVDLVMSESK